MKDNIEETVSCTKQLNTRWKDKTISDLTSRVPKEKLCDYLDILKENIDLDVSVVELFSDVIKELVNLTTKDDTKVTNIKIETANIFGVFQCKKEANDTYSLAYAINMVFFDMKDQTTMYTETDYLNMEKYQQGETSRALEGLGLFHQRGSDQSVPEGLVVQDVLGSTLNSVWSNTKKFYNYVDSFRTSSPGTEALADELQARDPSFEDKYPDCIAKSSTPPNTKKQHHYNFGSNSTEQGS